MAGNAHAPSCRGQIESSGSGQVESSAFRPRAKAKPAIPSSQDCVPAWRPGPVKTAPGLRAEEAVLTGGRYARRYRLREWQGNANREQYPVLVRKRNFLL